MILRRSFPGFGSLPDLQLGDHWCLPVDGDEERLSATGGIAGFGLRREGKVAVFTTTETPDELAGFLTRQLPGAAAALASGQLSVRACDRFHLSAGVLDTGRLLERYLAEVDLAEEQGYPGLWIAVDMAWILADPPGMGSLLEYEAAVNPGFAGHRVAAACIYDRTKLCRTLVECACAAHPLTPGQAPLRFAWTTDPPGLMLSGETDLTNHGALTTLLDALHAMPGHITIDATELWFADLRAADLLRGVSSARCQGSTTIVGSTMVNRLLELAANCRSSAGGQSDA